MNNSKWVNVEDDLPDYDVFVLWIDEHSYQFIADIDHDNDWENFQGSHKDFNGDIVKITHWQPLPDPPEKK